MLPQTTPPCKSEHGAAHGRLVAADVDRQGAKPGSLVDWCASDKAFRHHPNARISGLRARFSAHFKDTIRLRCFAHSPIHTDHIVEESSAVVRTLYPHL
jgi:hypothetical protein